MKKRILYAILAIIIAAYGIDMYKDGTASGAATNAFCDTVVNIVSLGTMNGKDVGMHVHVSGGDLMRGYKDYYLVFRFLSFLVIPFSVILAICLYIRHLKRTASDPVKRKR